MALHSSLLFRVSKQAGLFSKTLYRWLFSHLESNFDLVQAGSNPHLLSSILIVHLGDFYYGSPFYYYYYYNIMYSWLRNIIVLI